jgi:hypothetical protein
VKLDVIIEFIIVPVSAAHLESTIPRLVFRDAFPVADDVGEAVTA